MVITIIKTIIKIIIMIIIIIIQLNPAITDPPVIEIHLLQIKMVGPLKSVRAGVNCNSNN